MSYKKEDSVSPNDDVMYKVPFLMNNWCKHQVCNLLHTCPLGHPGLLINQLVPSIFRYTNLKIKVSILFQTSSMAKEDFHITDWNLAAFIPMKVRNQSAWYLGTHWFSSMHQSFRSEMSLHVNTLHQKLLKC